MSRPPKSTAAATRLLERYAAIESDLILVEAARSDGIAAANATADLQAAPLLKERDGLAELLGLWFDTDGKALLPKGRKSLELGGCLIGSKAARARLGHRFTSDDAAAEALQPTRFAKHSTKTKVSLDRAATLKLLQVGGKTAAAIRDLGFTIVEPGESFFIQRAEQAGTIGG